MTNDTPGPQRGDPTWSPPPRIQEPPNDPPPQPPANPSDPTPPTRTDPPIAAPLAPAARPAPIVALRNPGAADRRPGLRAGSGKICRADRSSRFDRRR